MIDLLIAILIALGVHVSGTTNEQVREENPEAYERATVIMNTGGYKYTDTGVVIIESSGD